MAERKSTTKAQYKARTKATANKVDDEFTVREKLEELKSLLDDDLINKEDYEDKKSEILDRM